MREVFFSQTLPGPSTVTALLKQLFSPLSPVKTGIHLGFCARMDPHSNP